MKRKVRYDEKGRYGYVIYSDQHGSINFYYEFGGGHCVAILSLPTPVNWEKETGRPLEQREEILNFIGTKVVQDQAPGGTYSVSDQFLEIYSGKA